MMSDAVKIDYKTSDQDNKQSDSLNRIDLNSPDSFSKLLKLAK